MRPGHWRSELPSPGQLPEGTIITRYVMVADVIDPDGQRATWNLTDPQASAADILGLHLYGLSRAQAVLNAAEMRRH